MTRQLAPRHRLLAVAGLIMLTNGGSMVSGTKEFPRGLW